MHGFRLSALALLFVLFNRANAQDASRGAAPSGPPTGQPYGPPPPPPNPIPGGPFPPVPDAPPPPPVAPKVLEIIPVVEQTQKMSTKIAFVVDASGSMASFNHLGVAMGFTNSILGREGDELEVALYAFRDMAIRWPGFPHDDQGPPPPPGWTYFPSVPAYEAAERWLRELGAGGATNPVEAVLCALAEPIKELTVVIITDGDFGGPQFKDAVIAGQVGRITRGLDRAVVVVIGVGANVEKRQHLIDVGTTEQGGFYKVREADPPEAPEGE